MCQFETIPAACRKGCRRRASGSPDVVCGVKTNRENKLLRIGVAGIVASVDEHANAPRQAPAQRFADELRRLPRRMLLRRRRCGESQAIGE